MEPALGPFHEYAFAAGAVKVTVCPGQTEGADVKICKGEQLALIYAYAQ